MPAALYYLLLQGSAYPIKYANTIHTAKVIHCNWRYKLTAVYILCLIGVCVSECLRVCE